jgi:hypothetical protein
VGWCIQGGDGTSAGPWRTWIMRRKWRMLQKDGEKEIWGYFCEAHFMNIF